jgi:putative transposase
MQTQFCELTDSQWAKIAKFLPTARKRKHDLRMIMNAILWIVRTGAQWRNLDSKYPAWQSVYYYFRQWKFCGVIEEIHLILVMEERERRGKAAYPSLLSIDNQTTKIVPFTSEDKGIDGNKRINGRKRELTVDSLGLIWSVYVHSAAESDNEGGKIVVERLKGKMPRLQKILADAGYKQSFIDWVKAQFNVAVEIAQKPEGTKGFVPTAKRWLVERAFGIFNFFRRLSKDYEKTTESAEAMILLAGIAVMLNRIAIENF